MKLLVATTCCSLNKKRSKRYSLILFSYLLLGMQIYYLRICGANFFLFMNKANKHYSIRFSVNIIYYTYVTVKSAFKFLAEPYPYLSRALIQFLPFHPLLRGVFRGAGRGGGHSPLLDSISFELPNKFLNIDYQYFDAVLFIITQVHPHHCKISAYSPAYS